MVWAKLLSAATTCRRGSGPSFALAVVTARQVARASTTGILGRIESSGVPALFAVRTAFVCAFGASSSAFAGSRGTRDPMRFGAAPSVEATRKRLQERLRVARGFVAVKPRAPERALHQDELRRRDVRAARKPIVAP